jgi:DNA-binding NarL/FixJ family response regulator
VTIRVAIADDQALVRSGFRLILESRPDIEVVGEAEDGADAVELVREQEPDVLLLDIRMPAMDGIEATRRIAQLGCPTRVLILTTFDVDEYVHEALRAGASGFLLKDVTPEHLVGAVRLVRSGDALLAPTITRRLVERFAQHNGQAQARKTHLSLSALTQREAEVLQQLGRGLSNAELAAQFHLSEATVKTHVARILAKLQLRDRAQAVVFAYESGLVRPFRDEA